MLTTLPTSSARVSNLANDWTNFAATSAVRQEALEELLADLETLSGRYVSATVAKSLADELLCDCDHSDDMTGGFDVTDSLVSALERVSGNARGFFVA